MALQEASPDRTVPSSSLRFHLAFWSSSAAAVLVLYLRYPWAFRRPQFYAEEGRFFFADAYNDGWISLTYAVNGYFHALPRLLSNLVLTLQIPLVSVPAVLVFACVPVYLFLWWRIFTRLDLPLPTRSALVLISVLVPLGSEIFMNQTNIQWVMTLVPIVLYCGRPPLRRIERTMDLVAYALCFFTGPQSLILIPLLGTHAALTGRLREHRGELAVGLLAMIATGIAMVGFGTLNRVPEGFPGDAGIYGFAQLAVRTFLLPIYGVEIISLPRPQVAVLAALLPGLLIWMGMKVHREGHDFSRLCFAASALAFAATVVAFWRYPGLPDPMAYGIRFFYLPAVLLLWALIAAMKVNLKTMIALGALLLWFVVQVSLIDGSYGAGDAFPDLDWPSYAARAEAGEAVVVPITPVGWSHDMILESKRR